MIFNSLSSTACAKWCSTKAIGGFGTFVLHYLAQTGQLDNGLKIRSMVLPDVFIDHDLQGAQYDVAGLNAKQYRRHRGSPRSVAKSPSNRPGRELTKRRADQLLVDRGLAESRQRAQALILAGHVYAGERRIDKAGETIAEETDIEVRGRDHPWVSRGVE